MGLQQGLSDVLIREASITSYFRLFKTGPKQKSLKPMCPFMWY